jgi:hypothetical protein
MRQLVCGCVLVLSGACSQAPTEPEVIQAIDLRPLHHNIPATDAQGTLWYLCETQPRTYVNLDRKVVAERDHYIQREQCPKEPIE